ncbi:MAG: hypothetical protein M1483_00955 [Actinobacteria bacterium]|nr:hypothetical protein [Actinomycetota bacterium]MCL6104204.1 hypothetical protein [Actinomycetota bacterium]
MAKKKITLYIDESVAKAAKVSAIATKCTESVLVEKAIISYLDTKDIKTAKADLIKLLDEVAVSSNLVNISEDDIIDLAVKETKLVRKNRQDKQQSKANIS